MENNERPICHRAEDLVTYLYGEATAEEARDFASHMRQCDACRAEFNVFNGVHESIVAWRNEAIGSIAAPQPSRDISFATPGVVQHQRKLPALAALREFFTVSPLWLRGAIAFTGLLLCALLLFAVSRMWRQPTTKVSDEAKYTEQQFQQTVERKVAERVAQINQAQKNQDSGTQTPKESSGQPEPPSQVAANSGRTRPRNRLTREERVQLAADLGLIQAREEETPFVLPEQPDQPNQ